MQPIYWGSSPSTSGSTPLFCSICYNFPQTHVTRINEENKFYSMLTRGYWQNIKAINFSCNKQL